MTPERWREVCAVFDRLAPLAEAEREAELAALATQDEELAREARSLLAAEARDAGFLAAPAVVAAAAADEDRRGERVGPWELLAPLGAGGMGQVFLARRADRSFDKLVAVKFVHAELLSPHLRERFAAERQALAGLEHPGIARLLDGGESASGEPYLVLELVEGRSLLDYATRGNLPRRRRIELFLQVLRAVAYAHSHLVVHRDLKPANILVTDGGEAKLLDFGVAKILAADGAGGDAGGTGATRTALRALTPEYASPEQILGGATTTATDVYALGVVLFELMTGRRPYRVATGAPEEWADAALHQEVERVPGLGPDLDAIVRRALRKEPAERYPTVDAFAEDLQRLLEGRPVAARRGNLAYRAAKFAGRHRAALGASALALALLVATLAISAERLRRERDRATLEAETARSVAGFLATLFQNADPARTRGAKLTAREILDQGALRIERDLAAQPALQAQLLTVLGAVQRDLGLREPARTLLEKALALREAGGAGDELARAESLHELGVLDRIDGELARAQERLELALALREQRLPPGDPEVARTLAALSAVFRQEGEVDRARPLVERALEIARRSGGGIPPAEAGRWLNNLGLLHQDAGDYERARTAFTESLAILGSEGPDNPLPAIPLDNLGQVLRQMGRAEEALPHHERAADLVKRTWGAEHSQYGTALNSLGTTLVALDRQGEAIDRFELAAAVYTAALGPAHPYVAWPLRNQAEALLALGRPEQALPLFERALAIRRAAYGETHPETAQSLTDLGLGYAALGDLEAAERWLRAGLEQSRASLEPANLGLAEAEIFLADLLVRRRRPEEARALYAEALPILRAAMPADDPRILAVEAQLSKLGDPPGSSS